MFKGVLYVLENDGRIKLKRLCSDEDLRVGRFGPFTLTSTEAPTSIIDSGSAINVAGEGPVTTIPNEQLSGLGTPTVYPSIPLPGGP